jgi:hypothetical protein
MSSEMYIGCRRCMTAFHIGYLVTVKSNFVFYEGIDMQALEKFITEHTYCNPEGMRFPELMSEGEVDEDTWKVIELL